MEDAANGVNVIILDACRNNPFARSFRSSQRGLAVTQAITGLLIAYATAPDRLQQMARATMACICRIYSATCVCLMCQ